MTNNLKYMLRQLLPLTAAVLTMTACAVDDGDQVEVSELGAKSKEYKVSAQRGSVEIPVLANSAWQAEFTDVYADWLEIDNASNTNDNTLRVNFKTNDSFARMAKLRIFSAERSDTVLIKQYGALKPELSLATPNIRVKGAGEQVRTQLATNIDMEDVKFEVMYASGEDEKWITDHEYAHGYLFINCEANPTESTRNARVRLSFTDGWGDEVAATLYQTQANKDEELGKVISFDEAYAYTGTPITKDFLLEGYVVSNTADGNAGECMQNTHTGIDYTPAKKTVYIESLDGRYGFRLMCKTPEDNIFQLYSKITMMIKGATIDMDDNIDATPKLRSYTISGVTSNLLIESAKGSLASLPVKEKYMSELTDEDVYTYVTLKDCEFPVRKGPLTPVNEGYTTLFNTHSLAKYPILIRDVRGDDMYVMTNMTCNYRRDGSKLPYGKGKLSGVVVHETYNRFHYSKTNNVDDPENGHIGRYQLRHQTKDDIYRDMSDDFEASFSGLLFEIRYARIQDLKTASPTTEGMPGYLTYTSISISPKADIYDGSDWSALAPDMGPNPVTGDACGMTLHQDDGGAAAYGAEMGTGSDAGKGHVNKIINNSGKKMGTSIASKYFWDYDDLTDGHEGTAAGFLICFSTEGVATDQLSLQLATYAQHASPRWWKVEWSETGTREGEWHYIDEYTQAIGEDWNNRRDWCMSGPKYHNFRLPLEMLGRQEVFLRLRPSVNALSNYESYFNQELKIKNNTVPSYLIYVGIRYNK